MDGEVGASREGHSDGLKDSWLKQEVDEAAARRSFVSAKTDAVFNLLLVTEVF